MKKERIRKPRVRVTKNTRTEVIEERQTRSETERQALKQELDDLLDQVDDVLKE